MTTLRRDTVTNWSYFQNIDALCDREFKHSGHRPVQSVNYKVVDVPANHVQDSTNQSKEKTTLLSQEIVSLTKGGIRTTQERRLCCELVSYVYEP